MLYETYEKRVNTIYSIRNKIYQYRVLLTTIATFIVLLLIGFILTKGIIYDVYFPKTTYIYGENIEKSGKTLFSDISYEYSDHGKGEWTNEKLLLPGKYDIRLLSSKSFGRTNYKMYDFTIEPKKANVTINESIIDFGSELTVTTELNEGDYISEVNFRFDDLTHTTTTVNVESLKINNQNGIDVTEGYKFNFKETTIAFRPKHIKISLLNKSKTYDGVAITSNEFEVIEGSLLAGHSVKIKTDGSQVGVGNSTNTITEFTIWDGEMNVTSNYNVTYDTGKLEVTHRPITIKTFSETKVYDGLALSNINYEVIEGSLVTGHHIEIIKNQTIIEVGTIDNRIEFKIVDENEHDVTSNYDVSYELGTLEMTQRPITIKTPNDKKVYDGTPLFNLNFNDVFDSLIQGHRIDIINFESLVDVKTVENNIELRIYDEKNEDVTSNYDFTFDVGTLEVTPRPIKINTEDKVFIYNGAPLYNLNFNMTESTLLLGHEIKVVNYNTITDVGTIENNLEIQIYDENKKDVTNNYLITYELGTLEVITRPMTIKTSNATRVYNGMEFFDLTYEDVKNALLDGHHIIVDKYQSITNVGTVENHLEMIIYDRDNINVTNNYLINYELGTLEVTPRPITIKPVDLTKEYDGTALKATDGESLNKSDLISGHIIKISTNGSQTNVGRSISNITEVTLWNGDINVTSNYDISYETGNLEITPRPITIRTASDTMMYDGTLLSNPNYELIVGELVNGHKINIINITTIIDAGISDNVIDLIIYDESNNDQTKNYAITFENGKLEIIPRPITIRTASATKMYDGTSLSNPYYELIDGELVNGHKLNMINYITIIDAEMRENVIDLIIHDERNNDQTKNYAITYENGKLEITPRPIKITTASATKMYDGNPLSNPKYELIDGELLNGHKINMINYTTIIDAEMRENVIELIIYDESNNNQTKNYAITYENGKLEITPIPIKITTASATKMYDGNPLSNPKYELIDGELLNGHKINMINYTTIIDAEMRENVIDLIIYDESNNDQTKNYDITFENGKLEITPRPITITTTSATKMYDGTPLFNTDYQITSGSLIGGHEALVFDYASITDVGMIANQLNVRIYDANNSDVTRNYQVIYETGTLEVIGVPITIKTENATKTYDGSPLFNTTYQITSGSLIEGHEAVVFDYSSITDVGKIANQLDVRIYDANNIDVTRNYQIKYETGTLEVEPRVIEISTASDTKIYDGTPLQNHMWSLTKGNLLGHHHFDVTVIGTITDPGSIPNDIDVQILNSDLVDVTRNYEIVENLGILEVLETRIEITIRTGSDSKLYDGLPLEFNSWNLDYGELLPNHQLNVNVTGSITVVGQIKNTFTYDILDEQGNSVAHLYNVTEILGDLTVFASDDEKNGQNKEENFDISPEGFTPGSGGMNNPLFRVYPELPGYIYLRDKSYGNYSKTSWDAPAIYTSPYGISPLALSGLALDQYNMSYYTLKVQAIVEGLSYHMPYYSIDGYYENINDVYVEHSYGFEYDISYIPYTYSDLEGITLNNTEYQEIEEEYREFVYNNYLDLPNDTRLAILDIAQENGLDPNKPTIIEDVQKYIQNAAVYNLEYERYPDNVDVAIYFLTEAKEGICQQYATAGVVMYRALGFPARYVTGFTINGTANEWNDVTGMNGHAWVEIYIDGFGWVPIEVTGGGPGGGSGDVDPGEGEPGDGEPGEGEPSEGDPGEGEPGDGEPGDGEPGDGDPGDGDPGDGDPGDGEPGDGDPGDGEPGDGDPGDGEPGDGDPGDGEPGDGEPGDNNDGLDDDELEVIEVSSGDASKKYDGTPLINHDYHISGDLKPGHHTVVNITGEITEVGEIQNTFTVNIVNSYGEDVSDQYKIRQIFGKLSVVPNNDKPIIEIKVFDKKKVYDGTVIGHDANDFWIASNNLPSNYTVELNILGERKDVGFTETVIDETTLRILDENGFDVTHNFNIVSYSGSIEIVKREITVTSISAQKYYDGEPLTADIFYISKGRLANNETIIVEVTGEITQVGSGENTINNVTITDLNGNNVTKNYKINKNSGMLTILDEF